MLTTLARAVQERLAAGPSHGALLRPSGSVGRVAFGALERSGDVQSAGKGGSGNGGGRGHRVCDRTLDGRRGAAVALADVRAEQLHIAAGRLRAAGHTVTAITTDVAVEDDIRQLIVTTVETYGGLDILHNNAALLTPEIVSKDTMIADVDASDFQRVLSVNVVGYLLGAKHAIPHMISRGGGVIINTSSIAGLQADLVLPMYATSKAAIVGLTRNIATQYGKQGIRAVAVAPGIVLTDSVKENLSEEVIAGLVRHSLAPRWPARGRCLSRRVPGFGGAAQITGITIPIDGGLSAHFPTYAEVLEARAAEPDSPR